MAQAAAGQGRLGRDCYAEGAARQGGAGEATAEREDGLALQAPKLSENMDVSFARRLCKPLSLSFDADLGPQDLQEHKAMLEKMTQQRDNLAKSHTVLKASYDRAKATLQKAAASKKVLESQV